MPPPLVIAAAVWVAKKLTLGNLYVAAHAYGFHNIYRRMLQASKVLVEDPAKRKVLNDGVKEAMRFPAKTYQLLAQTEFSQFLHNYLQYVQKQTGIPPFIITLVEALFKRSQVGSWVIWLQQVGKKRIAKKSTPPTQSE